MLGRERLGGRCGRCPLREGCGGCRAVAWAVHGDALAEDPQCAWRPGWGERARLRLLRLSRRLQAEREGGG